MYRVGVKQKMDVGHFLIGDFGEESVPHRHDYEVEWRFDVSDLDSNGFAVDIAWMRELLELVAEELRGTMLNDHPFFKTRQTSVENFSRFVMSRLAEIADSIFEFDEEGPELVRSDDDPIRRDNPFDSAKCSEIIVWESEDAWASFSIRPGDTN